MKLTISGNFIPIKSLSSSYLGFISNDTVFDSFEKARQHGVVEVAVLEIVGTRLQFLKVLTTFYNHYPLYRAGKTVFSSFADAAKTGKRVALFKATQDSNDKTFIINMNK